MTKRNAPWSISKASVAHECNRRFHFRYHRKHKGAASKNNAGLIGSAAHAFVESLMLGHDVPEAYRRACAVAPLTTEERRTLQEFNEPAHRFLQRFNDFCKRKSVGKDSVHVEKEVAFRRDGTLCGYWDADTFWRGKWDVGVEVDAQDGEGGLRILIMDHKTGTPSHDKLEAYQAQLNSYIVSAYYAYPNLVSAQTVLHWLKEEDPKQMFQWGKMYTREAIRDELLGWFFDYYEQANLKANAEPVATPGWFCTFCEYRNTCPAHQQP